MNEAHDIPALSQRCRRFREESKMTKSEVELHATIDAHAGLISAIPEVLAAFKAITQHSIEFFGMGRAGGKEADILNAALSSIAKAEGRSHE